MDIAMPIAVAAIAVGCTALGIAQDYVPALSAAMGKIPGLGKIKAKADGHAPAAAHHHGCCGCLGPCAGAGMAALPSAPAAALSTPCTTLQAAASAPRTPDLPQLRFLPFANGPPSLLG